MKRINAASAKENLYKLIDETNSSHEPVFITGRKSNAILISEDNWRAIQETLHLSSIPGMKESITNGLKTPVSECSEKIEW
jgi:antitoxin YefM